MTVVKAYQCKYSNALFSMDNKDGYTEHVKAQRAKLAKERKIARARKHHDEDHKLAYTGLNSFMEIEAWARDSFERFWRYTKPWEDDRFYVAKHTVEFVRVAVTWNDNCSNTHSCPRDGIRNFGCKSDKPSGYPGWEGRISIKFASATLSGTSNALSAMGLHTGSGGGSINSCTYGLTMFASDWPALYEVREANEIMERLRGK